MTKYFARPVGTGYDLYCGDERIGHLTNRNILQSSDSDLAQIVNMKIDPAMPLAGTLAVVRAAHEAIWASRSSETAFELACEMAWVRRSEYDPEAHLDLEEMA